MTPVPDANLDRGGTDNAAALQALLDAGRLPPPGAYGVGSTLTCENFVGKGWKGKFAGVGGPDNPSLGVWLIWQGPENGTLLRWRGMKGRLKNVAFACARNTSLDRCIDVEKPDGGLISTSHRFKNVSCDGRFGPVSKGWVFGEDQSANGEFMRLTDCSALKCRYAGVAVPSGTDQAEMFAFKRVTFSECLYGYAGARSSGYFLGCNFSWCQVGFYMNGGTGRPVAFRHCSSEGLKQFISAQGVSSVSVADSRLSMTNANNDPLSQEYFYGGNELHLARLTLEDRPDQAPFIRPTNGGNAKVENIRFGCANPFVLGPDVSYRLAASGVRLMNGRYYLPNGTYCNHYPFYSVIDQAGPPRQISDTLAALRPA